MLALTVLSPTRVGNGPCVRTAAVDGSERSARSAADAAMERYAAGDEAAFSTLFDLLAPRLHGYFLRQTRDADVADDLTQQTLLKIHRARGQFMRGAAVTPWAFAIGRRLLIDDVRRRRRDLLAPNHEETVDRASSEAPAADDLVAAQETSTRIRKALLRLPASQRAAFELVKQEGLTFVEAAETLGTTVAAVKLRAHRAYEALRVALGDVLERESPQRTATREEVES
jgi:RNA polymerase sigma-70 factor (ECF subfamily)